MPETGNVERTANMAPGRRCAADRLASNLREMAEEEGLLGGPLVRGDSGEAQRRRQAYDARGDERCSGEAVV